MKYLCIILSVISFFFSGRMALSQENFRSGYIITNSNDTLHGSIQYKGARQTALKCTFRPDNTDEITDFLPGQISGYRFTEGKFFVSRSVEQNGLPGMVFLEFLIQGKANIYALRDTEGSRMFIETQKDGFLELTDPERTIHSDSGYYYAPRKYYGKLRYMLADCPQIIPKINKVNLQPKPMIRLAKDYHNLVCPDEACTVFERKIKPIKVGISVHAGPVIKQISLGGLIDSDTRPGYSAGVSFRFSNVFFSDERFSLETGITMVKNNTFTFKNAENNAQSEKVTYLNKIYYINKYDEIYYSDNYIKVKSLETNTQLGILSIPLTLNYTYPGNKLRPGIGLGGVFSMITGQNEDFNYEPFSDRFGKTFPVKHIGYVINASLRYKTGQKSSLGFDLRYFIETSLFDANEIYRCKSHTFIAQIRYNFYW